MKTSVEKVLLPPEIQLLRQSVREMTGRTYYTVEWTPTGQGEPYRIIEYTIHGASSSMAKFFSRDIWFTSREEAQQYAKECRYENYPTENV